MPSLPSPPPRKKRQLIRFEISLGILIRNTVINTIEEIAYLGGAIKTKIIQGPGILCRPVYFRIETRTQTEKQDIVEYVKKYLDYIGVDNGTP